MKKNEDSQSMGALQFLPLKFAIRTWFCKCPQYLYLFHIVFWVHPKCTWTRKDVCSPKSSSLLSSFHIGSMFCFFPANFMSSTYTALFHGVRISIHNWEPFPNRTSNSLSHKSPAKGWPYKFPLKKNDWIFHTGPFVFWRTQNPRCRSPHKRAWMVTMSRRKRMVAHNITDTPNFLAVMVRRRPFFQEDPLIMFITLVLYIMPPNKVEVEPRFVVAALISRADAKSSIIRAQAQHVARNEENTMKPYFSVPIGFGRFKEPKNVSPVARNRSRCPQWCWARRHRQGALGKDFFDGTDIVDVVASPCSTLEVTSNHVHIVFEHHCTNCKDELLSYATFLSVNVGNV